MSDNGDRIAGILAPHGIRLAKASVDLHEGSLFEAFARRKAIRP
jgi:hypothetical protein